MDKKTLTRADLAQFTGTEQWFRHELNRNVTYTDGVHYVAETGGAYWLLDEIALAQTISEVAAETFQAWTLTVCSDQSAVLKCTNGDDVDVVTKCIPWTDFPLDEITFFVEQDEAFRVILLPSEH